MAVTGDAPQREPDQITALLHRVGVNMGDHAETIVTAVEVKPGDTVRDLLERSIAAGSQWRRRDYDHYVVLRFVEPADPPATTTATVL